MKLKLTPGDSIEPGNDSTMWTAGIHTPNHGNVIECYRKTQAEAEELRDFVLQACNTQGGLVSALKALLTDVENCTDYGMPFEHEHHPFHQTYTAAKKALASVGKAI